MLRKLKLLGLAGLLGSALPSAYAFVLLGPPEAYQVPEIGYMLPGDLGAPKNVGEQFRWNVPVLYYSYDQSFLDYFGSNGVRAVDQAFGVMNSLKKASAYSPMLTEVPLSVKRQNYRAQAANLLDVKSYMLALLVEQMGLGEPTRFVWGLHDRYIPPGVKCSATNAVEGSGIEYLVVGRNFGSSPAALDSYLYSPYINGVFYTYRISETCVPPNPLALAVPVSPDPYVNQYTPVADNLALTGDYYIGLSRDDVAGIRYLFRTNLTAVEVVAGAEIQVTNPPVILTTSNLVQLMSDASTNGPAALQVLYPTLQIASYASEYTNLVTTNYTLYFTNYPGMPLGSVPVGVVATNYTTNIGVYYQYQFANVITNPQPPYYTNSTAPYSQSYMTITYTNIVAGPYVAYPDLMVTNVYVTNVVVPAVSGDYYIMPTNSCGGLLVTSNQLSLLVTVTNATETILTPPMLVTNAINFLTTSNLAKLISDAYTNGPAALQALYPTLQITNYVPGFTFLVTTNLTPYYTNYPWSQYGAPPVLAYATNYTTNVWFVYQYQFGNVHTSSYSPYSLVSVLITNVTLNAWGQPGVVTTNVTTSNYWANTPSGDYYIAPVTNGCGGIVVLSNILSTVTVVTNGTVVATVDPNGTYANTFYTNYYYSATETTYFTNHNLAYFPVTCYSNPFASTLTRVTYFTNRNLKTRIISCETNPPAQRRGIDKITFVRNDNYDSLLGQYTVPVGTNFTGWAVAGNTNWTQALRRSVTTPDFLVSAMDLTGGPAAIPVHAGAVRNMNFNAAYKGANLAGPGTIVPPVRIAFNKVGSVYENISPYYSQLSAVQLFNWGSFDGTTAAPIVYPNGASLDNLENQLIMQITTTNLPTAKVGSLYTAALTGKGGQPPYVWSQAPNTPGMPPGITLQADGSIYGIPRQEGVYDITIRMTDAGARYIDQAFTITVSPP